MTKEELLSKLREISDNLNHDNATKITEDTREQELKDLQTKREMLRLEARELERKLSDDQNYQDFSYIKNQSKIYDYNARLDKISEEIAQNEADRISNNSRIEYINKEVAACNALLSETQKRLEQYGVELRNLGENTDLEKDKEIADKMVSAREDISYLKSEMDLLNAELLDLNTNKDELSKRANTLSNSSERYSKLLETIKSKEENTNDTIDHNKKNADQRKLLQLQASIDAVSNREAYISFDFPIELETLIDDIQNDRISQNDMLIRLKELKENMPEKLANKDYKNAEEELNENKKIQAEILMEKLSLEEKLAKLSR